VKKLMTDAAIAGVVMILSASAPAEAAEITVLGGMGVVSGLRDLAPARRSPTSARSRPSGPRCSTPKSIGYSQGGSGLISAKVMEKLGIARAAANLTVSCSPLGSGPT
jgi:hypothetical protein